ncbi:hypothetical protein F4804DRAFT_341078 [Jackrogersella minutella]|nr:hypothetical protein F4804DRAFT_341078 [Jackrogersella minutella]
MDETKSKDQHIPSISAISNEILLIIFESELLPADLLHCMLCCKRWSPLSSSVLYKHLVLNTATLPRFTMCSSDSEDSLVETFTFRHSSRFPEQWPPEAVFDKLPSRLAKMVNLRSFSLSILSGEVYNKWISEPWISAIVDSLPRTCRCLEIDIEGSRRYISADEGEQVHLCASIRRILPSLRFLRLNLSKICPDAFGFGFDRAKPSVVDVNFKPIEAPHLEECLIKTAVPQYTTNLDRFRVCGCHNADIITILAKHLQPFKLSSNASCLTKLWLVDALPMEGYYTTYQSIVRRDVLANKSQALPYKDIGLLKHNKSGVFIRMPVEEGGNQDLVSTIQGVMSLAEEHAWVDTTNGTRVPAAEISRGHCRVLDRPVVRTAEEWLAKTNISCHLWADEYRTGTRMLNVVEGGLTEDCFPIIQTPDGWTRTEGGWLEKLE